MGLFCSKDRRVDRVSARSREAARFIEDGDDLDSEIDLIVYTAPGYVIRDRLEQMGFTMGSALKCFAKAVSARRKGHRNTNLTANEWMLSLKQSCDETLMAASELSPRRPDDWHDFPSYEIRHAIRLALEVFPDDQVVYDLTGLSLVDLY